MFDRELRRLRESVRRVDYVFTLHGLDEMEEDRLTVLDVESCVLTGSVAERQRDRFTGESKYVIKGRALGGANITVVAKWLPTGRMAILTVYRT